MNTAAVLLWAPDTKRNFSKCGIFFSDVSECEVGSVLPTGQEQEITEAGLNMWGKSF